MIRVVSIKFRTAGKHYTFKAQNLELNPGDQVVVETDRGRALGNVVDSPREIPAAETPEDIKSVLRPATDEDRALAQSNTAREKEAFRFCQQRIHDRKMEMKLVRAEYLFDGSKIIFYFTADGRVDFRELVKDLAHHFHTRIEMRQIGVRDEAKLTGGIGICGRELCCCTFLTEFAPVSVRMAKEQGLALNPSKISGQCGRLLCCLGYEFKTYCSLKKSLPKCGKKVAYQGGEAEVINQKVLSQTVTLRLGDGQQVEVKADTMEPAREQAQASPESRQQPKGQPRDRQRGRGGKPGGEGKRPQRGRPEPGPREARPQPESKTPSETRPAAESKPPAEGEQQKTSRKRSRSRRRPRRK